MKAGQRDFRAKNPAGTTIPRLEQKGGKMEYATMPGVE